ncbi:MAG: VOC family protein [Bacteroidales bacterium]|nr:VOC family protein [Bacteroidales bacterium]
MKIHHFAIWCQDIELMRSFYIKYFCCESNSLYHNPKKHYTSYFLSFNEGDCKIELMNRPDITDEPSKRGFIKGIAHFDIEVGDEKKVDELTEQLRLDGYVIASEPRKTGDGYYEAGILDPEGNYVEISASVN